jgi:DNA invertase Pin-like site-specific DNA recombinase
VSGGTGIRRTAHLRWARGIDGLGIPLSSPPSAPVRCAQPADFTNSPGAFATKIGAVAATAIDAMPQRLALYIRPTLHADADAQRVALLAWAEATGHHVVSTFSEPERKRGPDHRREASRMLAAATRGAFDVLAAVSLAALVRSVRHGADMFTALDAAGVTVCLLGDGLDTATDDGATLRALLLAARLDHDLNTERATIGVQRRIAAGFKHGAPRIPASAEARIVALLRAGASTTRIRRMTGAGYTTVLRIRNELALADPLPSRTASPEATAA